MTTNTAPAARLTITGDAAREIRSHVNHYIRPLGGSWVEVQSMRECQHGCKLHVRQRGAVRQYALLHYAGYGCKLGRDEATRTVPVSVRPAV